MSTPLSGGYCSGVPPLPIPNREVKPACADGTAMQCGRVGGRHFSLSPVSAMKQGSFRWSCCLSAQCEVGKSHGDSPAKSKTSCFTFKKTMPYREKEPSREGKTSCFVVIGDVLSSERDNLFEGKTSCFTLRERISLLFPNVLRACTRRLARAV